MPPFDEMKITQLEYFLSHFKGGRLRACPCFLALDAFLRFHRIVSVGVHRGVARI